MGILTDRFSDTSGSTDVYGVLSASTCVLFKDGIIAPGLKGNNSHKN